MATGEPLGSARIDIEANVKPLEAGMDRAKAVATTKAAEIQRAATVTATAGGASPAAATQAVTAAKNGAAAAGVSMVALAGAIGAVLRGLDELYRGFKAFQGAGGALGDELKAIQAAFQGIAKINLDTVSNQVRQTETLAAAQRRSLEIEIEKRNIIQEAAEFVYGNSTEAVKLQAIEQNRLATLNAIVANEKEAAKIKAEAAREDANRVRDELRQKMSEEALEKRREIEKEIEDDRIASVEYRASIEKKIVADAMAAAKAWEAAIRRIQDQQAALFNGNDIPVMLQQLTGAVDALTRARQNGGGF